MKQQNATGRRRRQFLVAGTVVVFVGITLIYFGQTTKPVPPAATAASPAATSHAQPQQKSSKTPAAQQGGLTVFVDPQTGQVRGGTAEELQALVAPGAQKTANGDSANEPQPFTTADGLIGMRLPESFNVNVVASRNPDGTISFSESSADNKDLSNKKEVSNGR